MSSEHRLLDLLPPLLAGFAATLAVETSAGVLLYSDTGFLPALTIILTVETGALGFGLWVGAAPLGDGIVERIRRRWLFCLVSFALAAILSAGLGFKTDLAGTVLGQGLGLALLGGLPLFSIGALLGIMVDPGGRGKQMGRRVGAATVFGAALGFLTAGTFLIPNAAPQTLFLLSLVALSGGALVQGKGLDRRLVVSLLEVRDGPTGDVRLERRGFGGARKYLKVLLEGGRIRGAENEVGNAGLAWEAAVAKGLAGGAEGPSSIFLAGGGSGTLARLLSVRESRPRMLVSERSQELVEVARSGFSPWAGWDEMELQVGDPLAPILRSGQAFDLLVVDSGVLPILDGQPVLVEEGWRLLAASVEAGGILVVGGVPILGGEARRPLNQLVAEGLHWFFEAAAFEPVQDPGAGTLLPEDRGRGLLVFSTSRRENWPPALPGFRFLTTGEG